MRRPFGDDCVLTRSLEFEVLNEGVFIFKLLSSSLQPSPLHTCEFWNLHGPGLVLYCSTVATNIRRKWAGAPPICTYYHSM